VAKKQFNTYVPKEYQNTGRGRQMYLNLAKDKVEVAELMAKAGTQKMQRKLSDAVMNFQEIQKTGNPDAIQAAYKNVLQLEDTVKAVQGDISGILTETALQTLGKNPIFKNPALKALLDTRDLPGLKKVFSEMVLPKNAEQMVAQGIVTGDSKLVEEGKGLLKLIHEGNRAASDAAFDKWTKTQELKMVQDAWAREMDRIEEARKVDPENEQLYRDQITRAETIRRRDTDAILGRGGKGIEKASPVQTPAKAEKADTVTVKGKTYVRVPIKEPSATAEKPKWSEDPTLKKNLEAYEATEKERRAQPSIWDMGGNIIEKGMPKRNSKGQIILPPSPLRYGRGLSR